MQNTNSKGIFLNGKQQIINLFRHLSEKEKTNILKYIQVKNPTLARELTESTFQFEDLLELPLYDLEKVFSRVPATIIGLAIYNTTDENKKKVLKLIPREKAEEAFEVMNQTISNSKSYIAKAQNKCMEAAMNLARAKIISIH